MLTATLAAFLLQLVVPPQGGEGVVRGTVRSDATGSGIVGAMIELADGTDAVRSDSLGSYTLGGIHTGPHRLRFVAPNYDTLVVEVLLAPDAQLRLDVALTRSPSTLPAVRVVATAAHTSGAPPSTSVSAWRLDRKDLEQSPATDDVDLFQLLATAPQAQVAVESQAAVHVRGGSADQNLFLLDGAPVYSPSHGAQTMSAFSPDIVDGMVLHGGAPPARYGGRLSSVIDVRTAATIPSTFASRGALGANGIRSAVDIPLIPGRAGLTLSGRHSFGGLLNGEGAETALPGAWLDGFGKLALRVGNANISASSFMAENGLGFPSTVTNEHGENASNGQARNQFEWTTATQSISWRQPLGVLASIETRFWRARFDAIASWKSRSGSVDLGSRLQDVGASTTLSVPYRGGVFSAGMETERFTSDYDAVAPPTGGIANSATVAPSVHLASSPTITSAFAEHEWRGSGAWTFNAGVRGTVIPGATPRIEPRASATYRPNSHVAMSAGYARMHQYSQSLRNEESVLGTIMAPDLLVAYGAGGIPIASSDELAASTTFSFDEHTRLDLDWYARAMRGLVLVAPVTGEPFATEGFAVGSGHAWGGSASLQRQVDRLSLQGTWSLGRVTRRTGSARYRPAFAPGQAASIAAAYRIGTRTRVRSSIWASSGRLTTPLGDDVGWDTRDAFTGARELSGTPERIGGPLGGAQLPNYFRIDFGVRHTMPIRRLGITLTGFADVNNVLARENVATYVSPTAGASRRPLVMLPTSALVGLEWKY